MFSKKSFQLIHTNIKILISNFHIYKAPNNIMFTAKLVTGMAGMCGTMFNARNSHNKAVVLLNTGVSSSFPIVLVSYRICMDPMEN